MGECSTLVWGSVAEWVSAIATLITGGVAAWITWRLTKRSNQLQDGLLAIERAREDREADAALLVKFSNVIMTYWTQGGALQANADSLRERYPTKAHLIIEAYERSFFELARSGRRESVPHPSVFPELMRMYNGNAWAFTLNDPAR